MEAALQIFLRALSWLFLAGVVGCVVVFPLVAYRLFSVLFEPDHPGEK